MDKLQSLVRYCSPEHIAPSYGKTANALETVGTIMLIPTKHCLAVFTVKEMVGEEWTFLFKKIAAVVTLIVILPITLVGIGVKEVGRLLLIESVAQMMSTIAARIQRMLSYAMTN